MSSKKFNINIKEYKPENFEEWDNFVANSNNGTIFHQQRFLSYHPDDKFQFTNYMIYDSDTLIAVLPGGYKENGTFYWSPVGASYGSIVTKDLTFEISLAIVDAIIDFFKSNGTKEIFLIPPPLIYSKIYNQHLEYAMLYRKFDFEYHYISHSIDLTNEELTNYTNSKARKKIRLAKENPNLSIREVEDFDEYYPILLENKKKHQATPTHSKEDLIKLKSLYPDAIRQFNVYYDDIAIAGSTMFMANKNVALCFYNMLNYEYNHLHPAFLTIDFVIDWSRQNGYKWFDFGVSQDTASDNPMTPSIDLIFFKELFNTRGIFRSTYHLNIS
jgi:hypothetical protein